MPAPTGPSQVNPALRRLVVPIDGLRPHPRNARNGDVEAIAASLSTHGQYAPVVVQRSTGEVLKGNHVYAAALSLGWTELAATVIDVDDDQALRILIADNRASDLGRYDDALLAELLQELPDLDGTLFEDGDLARMLARIEADEQRALDAADGPKGLGEPIVSYVLVFDSSGQQNRWYAFLKWLRAVYSGDTIGERLYEHLSTVLGETADTALAPEDYR